MKREDKYAAQVIGDWPKRVPLSLLDKILMVLAFLLMLAPVVHVVALYGGLPAEVATGFDAGGVPDEYDGKWYLLVLAFADVLCTGSVIVCNFFPGAINVPLSLLKRPALEIIRGTRVYINLTGIFCAIFFAYMLEIFLLGAQGHPVEMSGLAVALFLVAVFGSMAVYFIWLWRGKGEKGTAIPPRSKLNTEVGREIGQWPEKLPLSFLDKILIGFSAILVILALVRIAMVYGQLPQTIPTHFGFNGEVDGTGGKSTLLVLGGIDVLIWVLLVASNLFPQTINLPISLMKRSAEEIIAGTRVLLNVMAVVICAFFWYIQEVTVQIALGAGAAGLNPVAAIAFIVALFGGMIVYIIWLWRA